jgi:hypothetical protein
VVQAIKGGKLVVVLDEWCPRIPGLALYYPGHRQVPAGLRAFVEVLKEAETGKALRVRPGERRPIADGSRRSLDPDARATKPLHDARPERDAGGQHAAARR